MKHVAILVVALLNAPAFAQSSESIGFSTVSEAYAALRKDPNAEFDVRGGWVIAAVRKGPHAGVWSFTPKSHPAHPAVVKRNPVEKDGHIYMSMQAICGAEKMACDQLIEEFKQLNERMSQELQNRSGKDK